MIPVFRGFNLLEMLYSHAGSYRFQHMISLMGGSLYRAQISFDTLLQATASKIQHDSDNGTLQSGH